MKLQPKTKISVQGAGVKERGSGVKKRAGSKRAIHARTHATNAPNRVGGTHPTSRASMGDALMQQGEREREKGREKGRKQRHLIRTAIKNINVEFKTF